MREDEYRRVFESEDSFWWYVGIHSLVESSLRQNLGVSQPTILDAGCGTGGNLVILQKYGNAVGIDLSQNALNLCKEARGIDNLARGTLESLPFRSGAFDAAISIDVLYHRWVTEDERALQELHRVLKPGGLLILQSAAFEWLRGQHDEVVYTRKRYTKSEICTKLQGAGFRVQTATYRNSLLFPLVFLVRLFQRKGGANSSDVKMPSPLVNSILKTVMRFENFLLKSVRFPVGSSVYAIAIKESV